MSLLRLPEVKAETGYRSHVSIYGRVKEGLFPKPVRIGQRSVAWPSDEVQAINAARIAGQSDDEMRALVKALHARRRDALQRTMAGNVPALLTGAIG